MSATSRPISVKQEWDNLKSLMGSSAKVSTPKLIKCSVSVKSAIEKDEKPQEQISGVKSLDILDSV